jgi:hypothetical protein
MKRRVFRGEDVSFEEARFVGFAEERPRSRNGWQNAATHLDLLYRDHDHDRDELSSEDAAMLASLMSIDNAELPPAHALDFLRSG